MKKIASIASTVVLLATSVMPVLAANSCTNGTTGPMSGNYCTVVNTNNVRVNNTNKADIVNNVTATSNTGHNSASMNTLGGRVTTGNASLNVGVSNTANINTTSISGGPAASGNVAGNNITGPASTDVVTITNSNIVNVNNQNDARIKNNVSATSDTGWNLANTNTGPADIFAGNASMSVSVGNHANDSATSITAGAGGSGGNSAVNDTTGPMSSNFVTLTNTSNTFVNNINDMDVKNNVTAVANTGHNSASMTTLGSEIRSGNAVGQVGIETKGNINTTSITTAMGGFTNTSGNLVTGPMSTNVENLVNAQDIGVNNNNVKGKVENKNTDIADTGWNVADINTGGGDIYAGLSQLVKRIETYINDSFTVIK